jgi:hypothetical protein
VSSSARSEYSACSLLTPPQLSTSASKVARSNGKEAWAIPHVAFRRWGSVAVKNALSGPVKISPSFWAVIRGQRVPASTIRGGQAYLVQWDIANRNLDTLKSIIPHQPVQVLVILAMVGTLAIISAPWCRYLSPVSLKMALLGFGFKQNKETTLYFGRLKLTYLLLPFTVEK